MCMFTVSNALLMSNATAMVRVGGSSLVYSPFSRSVNEEYWSSVFTTGCPS